MAKGDISIHDVSGKNVVPTRTYQAESGETAMLAGEPVKLKSAGSPFVIPLATAEPVIGTTTQVIGICASDSDATASANGTVQVYIPDAQVVWVVKATTVANVDTKSELDALQNDRVKFDLTGAIYTLDENEGDAAASGLQIVGGDFTTGDMYFTIRSAATEGPIA